MLAQCPCPIHNLTRDRWVANWRDSRLTITGFSGHNCREIAQDGHPVHFPICLKLLYGIRRKGLFHFCAAKAIREQPRVGLSLSQYPTT
jgi:hypothetical protein